MYAATKNKAKQSFLLGKSFNKKNFCQYPSSQGQEVFRWCRLGLTPATICQKDGHATEVETVRVRVTLLLFHVVKPRTTGLRTPRTTNLTIPRMLNQPQNRRLRGLAVCQKTKRFSEKVRYTIYCCLMPDC